MHRHIVGTSRSKNDCMKESNITSWGMLSNEGVKAQRFGAHSQIRVLSGTLKSRPATYPRRRYHHSPSAIIDLFALTQAHCPWIHMKRSQICSIDASSRQGAKALNPQ